MDSDLDFNSRVLELEGLIVVPALIDPAEVGAEPVKESLSVGAVSEPPAASSFLCFWHRQTFVAYSLIWWHGLMQV